ncbi:hypothetical protein D9M70_430150 [compost metagenome]
MAQKTRSTRTCPALSTDTSATCATTLPNDSCKATPRPTFPTPGFLRKGWPQPDIFRACSSTARWRSSLSRLMR